MEVRELLIRRNADYVKTFSGAHGRRVLADLKRFCRATLPTADVNNERVTYLQEGRREVWLRIMSHIHVSEEEIYALTEED